MTVQASRINRRVLIIDDNHAIHDDFRKILCPNPRDIPCASLIDIRCRDREFHKTWKEFDLVCTDQGQRGLKIVECALEDGCPFAMAFVDMRMPTGWDGIETTEQLWKIDPDLQIVICTAHSDLSWEHMRQRLGHSEKLVILRKPFETIEVQQIADSFTAKWNLARQVNDRMEFLDRSQRSLQHALAESEGLVGAVSSILIGLDEQDCVIRWNAAAWQVFGVSAAMALGHPLRSIELHWDWNVVNSAIQQCRAQRQAIRIHEVSYSDPSNTNQVLGITVSPILGEEEELSGVLILGKNITQQRQFEAQQAMAQKMESIGRLAAGVAHEINTPIHYVTENVRFLMECFGDLRRLLDAYRNLVKQCHQQGVKDCALETVTQVTKEIDLDYLLTEIPTILSQCQEGTGRVGEIVRAMNEFSHPGEGEPVMVDLNHSLQGALKLAMNEWKDIADVVTDFSPDLPHVPGLSTELSQVWVNLLLNATQAIQGGRSEGSLAKGTIWVSTRQDQKWVEVRVSDTGIGIDESIRDRVFDLFFTTKDVGMGTGQGLALAHAIVVQRHSGELSFEPSPSGGTTFIVRLPFESALVEREVLNR